VWIFWKGFACPDAIVLVAVITHAVLLPSWHPGARGRLVGVRAGLAAVCVIVMRWPGPFAAAWRDRYSPALHVPMHATRSVKGWIAVLANP
jgi:hypothetical protein